MASRLPVDTFRKLMVSKVTNKFREAIVMVKGPVPEPGPHEILVKNRFVGINASDINYTAGRYDPSVKPPFPTGFEGMGEVVSIGEKCKNIKLGQPVAYIQSGAFAEYIVLPARQVMQVPDVRPEYIPLLVSGLTAAISFDKCGEVKAGDTVLVTAAAGGTGQFAVQIAKNAGCHVVGMCSTDAKVDFLKDLGCDRIINTSHENLYEVLKKEYPKGIDMIYESIGGEVFDICVNNLAVKGRLVLIGYITGYQTATGLAPTKGSVLPPKLLAKSASIRGFFLNHYMEDWPAYMQSLLKEFSQGKIRSICDTGKKLPHGPFVGLDNIAPAIDYLYSRKSIGKIIVEIPHSSQL